MQPTVPTDRLRVMTAAEILGYTASTFSAHAQLQVRLSLSDRLAVGLEDVALFGTRNLLVIYVRITIPLQADIHPYLPVQSVDGIEVYVHVFAKDHDCCSEIAAHIGDIQNDPDAFCLEVEDQIIDADDTGILGADEVLGDVPDGFGFEITEDPSIVGQSVPPASDKEVVTQEQATAELKTAANEAVAEQQDQKTELEPSTSSVGGFGIGMGMSMDMFSAAKIKEQLQKVQVTVSPPS